MIYIQHRVNDPMALAALAPELGVEIDLRSAVDRPDQIHLSHDPWNRGADFDLWLDYFVKAGLRGPLILNTKEDGLEELTRQKLRKAGLENWFFLDTTLPTLRRYTYWDGEKRFAIRLSSVEGWESAVPFLGKADWVWVDCFDGIPVDLKLVERAAEHFKVCLVSPELQGCALDQLEAFAPIAARATAICTKKPEVWADFLKTA